MSTISEINEFVNKYEALFKKENRNKIKDLKSEKTRQLLLSYLEAGRIDLALKLIEDKNKIWLPWLFDIYLESVSAEIERNKNSIKRISDRSFIFDPTQWTTNDKIRQVIAILISTLIKNQQNLFLYIVNNARIYGESNEDIIKRWIKLVGLTNTQAQKIIQFNEKLNQQKKLDEQAREAGENIVPQTDKQIKIIVDGRINQMLDSREDFDAREIIAILDNESRISVISQISEQLGISQDQIEKEWICRLDDRVRWTHDSHGGMHGQKVLGLDGYFKSPSGARLKYPHDPNAPISETANCRCRLIYRLKEN